MDWVYVLKSDWLCSPRIQMRNAIGESDTRFANHVACLNSGGNEPIRFEYKQYAQSTQWPVEEDITHGFADGTN